MISNIKNFLCKHLGHKDKCHGYSFHPEAGMSVWICKRCSRVDTEIATAKSIHEKFGIPYH